VASVNVTLSIPDDSRFDEVIRVAENHGLKVAKAFRPLGVNRCRRAADWTDGGNFVVGEHFDRGPCAKVNGTALKHAASRTTMHAGPNLPRALKHC
jgi:hypothetical protein